MWHGKEKEPAPDAPAQPPDVPKVPPVPKKKLGERWHEYFNAKKAEKESEKVEDKVLSIPPAAEKRVEPVIIKYEAHLTRRQFFTEEEEKNRGRFLITARLLERAASVQGLSGDIAALRLATQMNRIPTEFQDDCRLCFIGDVVGRVLFGNEQISVFRYNQGRWTHSRVPFELNLWTRQDWFVCEV